MFGTKISRLQKKSSSLLTTFTTVIEGLKVNNEKATKELQVLWDKSFKIESDKKELEQLKESNNKIISKISKIIE